MFWRVGARGEIVGETAGRGRVRAFRWGGNPAWILGRLVKKEVQLLCWLQLLAGDLAQMIGLFCVNAASRWPVDVDHATSQV